MDSRALAGRTPQRQNNNTAQSMIQISLCPSIPTYVVVAELRESHILTSIKIEQLTSRVSNRLSSMFNVQSITAVYYRSLIWVVVQYQSHQPAKQSPGYQINNLTWSFNDFKHTALKVIQDPVSKLPGIDCLIITQNLL